MDHGAHGDGGDRKGVAGLDVGSFGGDDLVAGLQAHRSQNVAALAIFIFQQRDEGAAVGVVLQAQDGSGHVQLVALEVDDAVLALVAAAAMADGDAAIAVAAAVLFDGGDQAAFGSGLFVHAVEAGHGHVSAGRRRRLECFNRHFLHSFAYQTPSKNSMVLESSLSFTTAFFQLGVVPSG